MEQDKTINDLSCSINTMKVTDKSSVAECPEPSVGSSAISSGSSSKPKAIPSEQEELIHRLVYYQNFFEYPSNEDLARLAYFRPSEGDDPSDTAFRYIGEMMTLTVQLIVEFAKNLSGFDKLLREDQIRLLKACSSEVMMIRMTRIYDEKNDSIVFARNQPHTKDRFNLAGLGDTIEDLFDFCKYMADMKVTNAEYALLTTIAIFSERPGLMEGWKVGKIQEIYIDALKAYVNRRNHPDKDDRYAQLLSVLTKLRTIVNKNKFLFKPKTKKLPPFLAELWNVVQ